MLVAPSLHQIADLRGKKPLYLYLWVGPEMSLLFDSGLADSPSMVIEPYCQANDLSLDKIRWVINSHGDADHFGGNAEIKAKCASAQFVGHVQDAELIMNHDASIRNRVNMFDSLYGSSYEDAFLDWVKQAMGAECALTFHCVGGEVLDLGPHGKFQILYLPGHTQGHIGLYNQDDGYVLIGDAVLGSGERDMEGTLYAPPSYVDVDQYRQTITQLQALDVHQVLRAHVAPISGTEIGHFYQNSRDWVDQTVEVLLDLIRKKPGLGFLSLRSQMNARRGPFVLEAEWAFAVHAHLKELESIGYVQKLGSGSHAHWVPM